MLASLLGGVVGRQFQPFFPREHRLVLGAVIFENTPNVLQERHRKDHDDEEQHPDKPVDEVKGDPRVRLDLPQ
jgi:hypothetical protein